MAKLIPNTYGKSDEVIGYLFWCPGCEETHSYLIKQYRSPPNPTWNFNGDINAPSFEPSLLYRYTRAGRDHVCHLYLTLGQLRYLPDCTHALAGKVVPLPEHPHL